MSSKLPRRPHALGWPGRPTDDPGRATSGRATQPGVARQGQTGSATGSGRRRPLRVCGGEQGRDHLSAIRSRVSGAAAAPALMHAATPRPAQSANSGCSSVAPSPRQHGARSDGGHGTSWRVAAPRLQRRARSPLSVQTRAGRGRKAAGPCSCESSLLLALLHARRAWHGHVRRLAARDNKY